MATTVAAAGGLPGGLDTGYGLGAGYPTGFGYSNVLPATFAYSSRNLLPVPLVGRGGLGYNSLSAFGGGPFNGVGAWGTPAVGYAAGYGSGCLNGACLSNLAALPYGGWNAGVPLLARGPAGLGLTPLAYGAPAYGNSYYDGLGLGGLGGLGGYGLGGYGLNNLHSYGRLIKKK